MASILITLIFAYYLIRIIKTKSSGLEFLFIILILSVFLLTSQYSLIGYGGYYSPEHEGHANEVLFWRSYDCSLNYSIFEPFKTFAMHISCKFNSPWLFDLIYKLAFALILIWSYFSKKLWVGMRDLKTAFFIVGASLTSEIIYGGPRTPLATLLLLIAYIIMIRREVTGIFFSLLSPAAHAVGFLAPNYLIAATLGFKFIKSNSKGRIKYAIFSIVVVFIIGLLIFNYSSDFIFGSSDYIGNKNASNYAAAEDGNVTTWFGMPRSFFIYPIVFFVLCWSENTFLKKGYAISITIILCVFVYLGMIISAQVAARFIGFTVPLLSMLIIANTAKRPEFFYRCISTIFACWFVYKSFYDNYQISIAESKDFLGLPVFIQYLIFNIVIVKIKILEINVYYPGLGDQLFYSHLPRIAKELYGFEKVIVYIPNNIRSIEISNLVWAINPYVDEVIQRKIKKINKVKVNPNCNILDNIMLSFGMDDGIRGHNPELYYKPVNLSEYNSKTIFDPNYISYVGSINKKKFFNFFKNIENEILQLKLKNHGFTLPNVPIIQTSSLLEYCAIIISAKNFICLSSGSATLASALNVNGCVLYGNGQDKIFHHSLTHQYIDVGDYSVIGYINSLALKVRNRFLA